MTVMYRAVCGLLASRQPHLPLWPPVRFVTEVHIGVHPPCFGSVPYQHSISLWSVDGNWQGFGCAQYTNQRLVVGAASGWLLPFMPWPCGHQSHPSGAGTLGSTLLH